MKKFGKIKEIYENAKISITVRTLSIFHKKEFMEEAWEKKIKKSGDLEAKLFRLGDRLQKAQAKKEADLFSRLPKDHQATIEIKAALEKYDILAKNILLSEFDNHAKEAFSVKLEDDSMHKKFDEAELINLHLKALVFQNPEIIRIMEEQGNIRTVEQIIDVAVKFCDSASVDISDKPKKMHDYLIEKNKDELTKCMLEIIGNENFYKVAGALSSISDLNLWGRVTRITYYLVEKDAKKSLLFLKKLAEMDADGMKEAIISEHEIDRQIFHEKWRFDKPIIDKKGRFAQNEAITPPIESARNIVKIYNFNKNIEEMNKENPDDGKKK